LRFSASLLLVLLPLLSASARVRHNDVWARQHFATAERMREALNGRPADERTRREYQRVINAYRSVYFGAPASSKADPSVVATAELMVEMGRQFDDNKILRGAIEQYRFLRKEYPGSKYRFDALFTIGEVYKDDLDDPEEARATFENFLHRYPRNHLADDARSALKELDADAEEMERAARKPAAKSRSGADDETANAAPPRRSKLPRVTGVRHWSTPDYTRVAVDIEQDVKFESQRIAHPDRIFFDLRDTKLASTLVGKTFDVDDGFLKKIRVAEFQPGRTRVVLEVDELASYNAFLLPNPYRLIIDVHGKQSRATLMAKAHPASDATSASATDSAGDDDPQDQVSERVDDPKPEAKPQKESSRSPVRFSKAKTGDKNSTDEADLPPTAADSSQPVSGIGVVRTTVPVPGSNRKIPKTIVEAEDHAPTTVATLEPDKLRPEVTPAQRAAIASADESKPSKLEARPSRKKKSRAPTAAADTADLEIREARPTAAGDRSLIRALGLKIGKIVIDAGHGGHDTGTIGPNGLLEKDLVLDVAKRLGRLLETRLGAEVIYTRQDDTFIPLETRTAIANRERADLFISVHANSSRDSDARGVETYYLNFTSSPEALEVAARENAVSEKSIHELQDLVKKIALKEKIEESREFASNVQESLYGGLSLRNAGVRNRGIKKAPFIVLIGANMPSILAEISFVSNPSDERKLQTAEHRQRIAESLYRGVSKYVSGLSGVKVASKGSKSEGQ
jgi:N-acetylmuramoyl-L-alanine amidase